MSIVISQFDGLREKVPCLDADFILCSFSV